MYHHASHSRNNYCIFALGLIILSAPLTTKAMGDSTPIQMQENGMEMGSGYSVDDLAPLAMVYYDGQGVYFTHPENI